MARTEGEAEPQVKRLSRNALIKRAGVMGVGATAAAGVLARAAPAEVERVVVVEREELEALEVFTAQEAATLDAMVARLIPSDGNGGGAAEARVGRYIDRQLTKGLSGYKQDYVNGLAQTDAYSQKTYGAPFAGLSAAQQDAVLTNMQANTATGFSPSSRTFFNIVRDHAIQGMFCDPFHGGNAGFVGWDLIGYPGIKIGAVLPTEQAIGTNLKKAHRSGYSHDMFLKTTKKETRLRPLNSTKKGG